MVGCRSARDRPRQAAAQAGRHPVQRNDLSFTRGTFRVRGDTVEIFPVYEELAIRIEMFGDEIERLYDLHPLTGEVIARSTRVRLPGHPLRGRPGADGAGDRGSRPSWPSGSPSSRAGQAARGPAAADAHHLRHRDDAQVGFCSGIENYSRHIDGRAPRQPRRTPARLLPRGLPAGHRRVARHRAADRRHVRGRHVAQADLVEHGFRLPSAMDNRPLKFEEFVERIGQTVYLSATPGPTSWPGRRSRRAGHPADRADRPEVVVKPTKGQIDDLMHEIRLGPSATSGCWSPR
jgi:excinuclease ABC subunit B